MSRRRRNSRARFQSELAHSPYQILEDRHLLAANLFVDFGDNFPGGTLVTTQGGLRDIANAPAPNDRILGVNLRDSANGFNAGTQLNIVAQTFTAIERARMMAVVERAFLPLDIDVVELTSTPQTTLDGRSVVAATSMADVVNTLRGGDTTWKDAYIFVGTFIVDPGGPNQQVYGNNGGGTSPENPTLGTTSDLASGFNRHDDLGVVYSNGGISNNTTNNISHEAGHLLGLRHSITNATPTASINLFHQLEIMSYRNTNNTTSSTFTRYPMIRGDGNSPAAPPNPVNYNDLAARNGQVTLFDQARMDPDVLANPNYTFVSGTGAHDIITITRNGANADVTVQAFGDAAMTSPITVPGEADTTYSYSIPLTKSILVFAGGSNDQIIVDADLGVDVRIDGMLGTDTLIVEGKGAANAVYTPNATRRTSVDTLSNGTATVDDFGGVISLGGHSIMFENFETTGRVEVRNSVSLKYLPPGIVPPTGNDELLVTASPIGANRNRISGTTGLETIVPLDFTNVVSVEIETGVNDSIIIPGVLNDHITIVDPLTATGLQFFSIDTGEGDDQLVIDATGALTLPVGGGIFAFDGGAGNDEIFGSDSSPDWLLNGNHRGGLDTSPFAFINTENLTGGSGNDNFRVTTDVPINMNIVGGGGTDTLFGPDAARTWQLNGTRSGLLTESFINFSETEGVTGGTASDMFFLNATSLQIAIDGGGGDDEIRGFDVNEDWVVGPAGGSTTQTDITFTGIETLFGGTLNDHFRIQPGVINIDIFAGAGDDTVSGPDVNSQWNLTGRNRGNISTSGVSFFHVETIRPGTAVDTINLGIGSHEMEIHDQGGSDILIGPNLPRVWRLTNANAGSVNFNNVVWTGIENLVGGSRQDHFLFENNLASLESINGGVGTARDHLNFQSRSNVIQVGLMAVDANGFDGSSTAITLGFTNIFRLTGTSAIQDQLTGLNAVSRWIYRPLSSRYVQGSNRLFFTNMERLNGGSDRDFYNITPSPTHRVMIKGGAPHVAPGDVLTINFAGTTNAQWNYVAPGQGSFNFDNRMPVNYNEIETLNVYDYGDANTSFGTLLADDGARHRLPALSPPIFLGSRLDPEGNGQPSFAANRDDLNGAVDDEDGVVVPAVLIPHFRAAVLVTASAAAKLDAWIDFDGNGVFSNDERIADNLSVAAGQTRLEFTTPLDALANVTTTARFRLSSSGGLGPTGVASNGEVEDYSLQIQRPDPGDIGIYPDPFFPGDPARQILIMAGTSGNDTMVANPISNDRLRIKINGTTYRPTTPSSQIQRMGAMGLEGNDSIIFANDIMQEGEVYGDEGNDDIWGGQSADYLRAGVGNDSVHGNAGDDLIFGEDGDDSLFGNAGNDILSGNAGNDTLYGLSDSDLLFGGAGADSLFGQTGGDLFVGNTSDFDDDDKALQAILAEWTSASSYTDRVDNVNNGTGTLLGSGIALVKGVTILDDGDDDELRGGLDQDAFFAIFGGDLILDLEAGEEVR